jgi:bifunctional DNA-binding transcriptional regulator/antitoxin component of YhaV-PrlF toxin-antitoxin module
VKSPQTRHRLNTPPGHSPVGTLVAPPPSEWSIVTGQLIAPLIPLADGPAHSRPSRAGAIRPLPLASPLAIPLDAVYRMSRIDASGRLTSQAITQVLGWQPGDRVTLTADAGVIVVRRDPHGMVTVPARCSIAIPAGLRHRCGLRPGDQVLLAALPSQDALAACTFAVVDQALRAHPLFSR